MSIYLYGTDKDKAFLQSIEFRHGSVVDKSGGWMASMKWV